MPASHANTQPKVEDYPAAVVDQWIARVWALSDARCDWDHHQYGADSGRSVGAGVKLEVADHRRDPAAVGGDALAGAEGGMATHRVTAFAFTPLSCDP